MKGIVYLVGAGPGDPGLLTLRAAELLKRAEILVYDYLASPEIIKMVSPTCQMLYVGKKSGCHEKTQSEINSILVKEAKKGRVVVRLKGGDPYIFGRGGEEAQELTRAGLNFEVVPGISSTVGAAAYAGIPLTHRDCTSAAALVTGHERPEKKCSSLNWEALAKMDTVSMVMGLQNLAHTSQSLISAGRPAQTPAALIQWGTTTRQRTLVSTLGEIAKDAAEAKLTPPVLFVVGDVVALRDELNWFEKRPLFGRKILVTRSRKQASKLTKALTELGAEVWERPTIDIESLAAEAGLKEVMGNLQNYDWLVFTSPNGAEIFCRTLFESGRDARALSTCKIAVIGPGTDQALAPYGLRADLTPGQYVAESLLEALLREGVERKNILLPRAQDGRDVLPEGLAAAGAKVLDLPIYKTINPVWSDPLPGVPDLTTVTSSSTAEGLAQMIPLAERLKYKVASIGPITTKTARSLGFEVVTEAEKFTIDGLVEAVLKNLG